jgi:hypothetical protein
LVGNDLDNWDVLITVGPYSVDVAWTFVNLSENPYKPKIEK